MLYLSMLCVLVSLSLSPCSGLVGQAPGDEDNRCTVNHDNPPSYPVTVKNLMDSYSYYVHLLPPDGTGPLWNSRSIVTNETNTWQIRGGLCRKVVASCTHSQPNKDNWLFTQYINNSDTYNYAVNIHVNVSYSMNCFTHQGCKRRFRLHNYTTNEVQSPTTTGSGFMNIQNFMQFATVKPVGTKPSYTDTHSLTLNPSDTGFYLAIRDNGTCIDISRVIVYCNNCQSRESGLVRYPDAPAPVSDSENIAISCVPNAVVSGSAQVTCNSDGTWGPENPVCECRLGYSMDDMSCQECPAGTYRSALDIECMMCPANTDQGQAAVGECQCLNGYFRDDVMDDGTCSRLLTSSNELASSGCTEPPSAPQNIALRNVSTTTEGRSGLIVTWAPPNRMGSRSDLYYKVQHSNPEIPGEFFDAECVSSSQTSHTFNDLRPYTQYCVRVIADNGVSDQDPDGTHLRTVEECTRTAEQSPGPVKDLQSLFPVVLWETPEEPNGVIENYELTFVQGGETKTATTNGDSTYYIIKAESFLQGTESFMVEVRARNGAGLGEVLCQLTVDPTEQSIEPQRCLLCPEQTVGLVHYPATAAPETGTIDVTTQCVENAEQTSSSLTVTCDSSGEWSNDDPPQCKCQENFNQIGDDMCRDSTTVATPTNSPPCPTCPEGIFVAESCDVVYVIWKPVSGAELYKLQFLEENEVIYDAATKEIVFNISVNDPKFENRIFSVEIGTAFSANGEVEDYSEPVEVNIKELLTKCGGTSEPSSNGGEDIDPVPLAIAVVVTFGITALTVSFLATVIGLIVNGRRTKKEALKKDYTLHSVNEDNKF